MILQDDTKLAIFDTSEPIDMKQALQFLGGKPEILFMMIENFEVMTIKGTMREFVTCYTQKDYK